ncbi:MAG: hypothetical protein ACRDDY_03805 [Clostridium sp.]|uniref:hypothetical protein n=1 Tax=Clostridium sp. TaxID=1506 RepID=UPI003EE57388
MKEYKINEDWVEITNAPSKLTLCPIIKPTAKAMIFIGTDDLIQKVLIGIKVVRDETTDTTNIAYEELTKNAENQSFMNRIYVSPFNKESFELKSGERLFVRCTSESGSLIISNTIIQGCK